jgi:hypothetical protein
LWHWPIFAFAENYAGRPLSVAEAAVLIAASIAIATASWRYVEQPFRYGRATAIISRRAAFAGGLGGLALASLIGIGLYLGDGWQWRLRPDTLRFYLASEDHNVLRPDCLYRSGHSPTPASRCISPASKARDGYDIIVWGDSHGDALFPAIAAIGQSHGLATRQVTKRGCPPLLGAEIVDERRAKPFGPRTCEKYNNEMLQELQQHPRPSLVVLVARWSMYTETSTAVGGGRRIFMVDGEHQTHDIETSRKVVSRALERTLDAIATLGIPVLLVGQAPEFHQDPNICFVERTLLRRDVSDCLAQPRAVADQRLGPSEEILLKVASDRWSTTYISLASILCDKEICRAADNNQPLYEDNNHLDLSGARVVGRAFSERPSVARLFAPQGSAYASIHRWTN